MCVTDDPEKARERVAELFVMYGGLPSYRAMLDREGASGPEDIAVIGSAAEVADRLAGVSESGVTTIAASEIGDPDELAATRGRSRVAPLSRPLVRSCRQPPPVG